MRYIALQEYNFNFNSFKMYMKAAILGLLLTGGPSLHAQNTKGVSVTYSSSQEPTDNTYALIVGISDYEHFEDLKYADKDALAFYGFLRSPASGAVDSNNIRMILNDKARAGDIWRDIGWLLRQAKNKGDRAIIYFSGHGDAANPEEAYLLAHDAPNEGDPNLYNAGGTFQIYNLKSSR